ATQRVIEGPCVALLEYEETLVPLRLSTHTPKSDDDPLVTCFLRTVSNRVSDIIEVETADFVCIHIRVTYNVTFLREQKDKWFNAENYIQVKQSGLPKFVTILRIFDGDVIVSAGGLIGSQGAPTSGSWTTCGPLAIA